MGKKNDLLPRSSPELRYLGYKQHFGSGFDNLWARGYYCSSAGHVSQEQVKRYIQEQQGKDIFEYDIYGCPTHLKGQLTIGDFTKGGVPFVVVFHRNLYIKVVLSLMIYHNKGGVPHMVNTRQKIIDYLKKADWPSTTEDIAADVKVSWNTAQVHLLKLLHEGIVRYKKVGRQNQFWLVKGYDKYFKEENKK